MVDRALITGISGFVGGHVALALLKAGYLVRGSVRNLKRADEVRTTLAVAGADVSQLEFVALDLMSDDGWKEAMTGVRYLHHVASPFVTVTPKDKNELIKPAVGGTERALNAALAADVEHVVLTSSIAAMVYGHEKSRKTLFTGNDWTNLQGGYVPPYQQSKTLAERRAWEIMENAGRKLDMTTINPGAILGPLLDKDPGTSAALILALLTGKIPMLPKITSTMVDVRDVAAGHLAAMTAPQARGKRIPFSESTISLKATAEILARLYPQRKVPQRELPNVVVRTMGLFSRDLKGVSAEIGHHRVLEKNEAAALLGRPLISSEEAIQATARSLFEQRLL